MEETTHTLTVLMEIGVALEGGKNPAELVIAVEDYLSKLAVADFAEGGRKREKLGDVAQISRPLTVKGVVVRETGGPALIQTGTAIKEG